jgi:hypothetical protein
MGGRRTSLSGGKRRNGGVPKFKTRKGLPASQQSRDGAIFTRDAVGAKVNSRFTGQTEKAGVVDNQEMPDHVR